MNGLSSLFCFLLLLSSSLKSCEPFLTAEALMQKSLSKETVFTALPGLTNKNYVFSDETGARFVLRIPGFGTDRFIDRNTEFANSKEAFCLQFNPVKIVHCSENGSQITEYIENFTSYSFEDFYRLEVIQEIAILLNKIHTSSLNFNNRIDLFDRISKLTTFLEENTGQLPPDFYHIGKKIFSLEDDLSLPCFLHIPSHGDPGPSNFMQVAGNVMLLDWEYSGLNDPAWDLAFLSAIMNYSQEVEERFLYFYNDSNPFLLQAKMQLFKPLVEYWLGLWSLSQTVICTPEQQSFFRYFSLARLAKAQQWLESREFAKARRFIQFSNSDPFYEESGQRYLKFFIDPERPLLTAFPRLSPEVGLTPVQFGLWICPYCGILNPIEKQCCMSPNCMAK
jgi:thiamine kinase-like enzyme